MSEWSLARDDAAPSVATDPALPLQYPQYPPPPRGSRPGPTPDNPPSNVQSRTAYFLALALCAAGSPSFHRQLFSNTWKCRPQAVLQLKSSPPFHHFTLFCCWQPLNAISIACRDAGGCNDICSAAAFSISISLFLCDLPSSLLPPAECGVMGWHLQTLSRHQPPR